MRRWSSNAVGVAWQLDFLLILSWSMVGTWYDCWGVQRDTFGKFLVRSLVGWMGVTVTGRGGWRRKKRIVSKIQSNAGAWTEGWNVENDQIIWASWTLTKIQAYSLPFYASACVPMYMSYRAGCLVRVDVSGKEHGHCCRKEDDDRGVGQEKYPTIKLKKKLLCCLQMTKCDRYMGSQEGLGHCPW